MLMPRQRGWCGVKHGAQLERNAVKYGARLARSDGRYGEAWRRHSEPRCGAAIKATPLGDHLGVVPCHLEPARRGDANEKVRVSSRYHCLHYDSVSMIGNLFFWLSTLTKPTDSRHWVGSFVVGILFPLLITAGLFILLALGGSPE